MSTDTITQKNRLFHHARIGRYYLRSPDGNGGRRRSCSDSFRSTSQPTHLCFFAKDEAGNAVGVSVDAILPKLGQMIGSVEELTTFVLLNGTNITPEQLSEDLEFHQGFELIAAALELNAGDDLKNSCAGIGKTLSGLVSATPRKTSTAASTPISAGTVSAPTT